MNFPRRSLTLIQFGIAISSLLAAQFALAYDHPLDSQAVQDAVTLSQDAAKAKTFLLQYVQALPKPESGPRIAQIALTTPFAQVVEASSQEKYTAQQATDDYQKRGDSIIVSVQVFFTGTYSGDEDSWKDFKVALIQKDHIAATSVEGEPLYASDEDGNPVLRGENIVAHFALTGVESAPVQVEVVPPKGATVHATFDLSKLR